MSRARLLGCLGLALAGALIAITGLMASGWWSGIAVAAGIVMVSAANLVVGCPCRANGN